MVSKLIEKCRATEIIKSLGDAHKNVHELIEDLCNRYDMVEDALRRSYSHRITMLNVPLSLKLLPYPVHFLRPLKLDFNGRPNVMKALKHSYFKYWGDIVTFPSFDSVAAAPGLGIISGLDNKDFFYNQMAFLELSFTPTLQYRESWRPYNLNDLSNLYVETYGGNK